MHCIFYDENSNLTSISFITFFDSTFKEWITVSFITLHDSNSQEPTHWIFSIIKKIFTYFDLGLFNYGLAFTIRIVFRMNFESNINQHPNTIERSQVTRNSRVLYPSQPQSGTAFPFSHWNIRRVSSRNDSFPGRMFRWTTNLPRLLSAPRQDKRDQIESWCRFWIREPRLSGRLIDKSGCLDWKRECSFETKRSPKCRRETAVSTFLLPVLIATLLNSSIAFSEVPPYVRDTVLFRSSTASTHWSITGDHVSWRIKNPARLGIFWCAGSFKFITTWNDFFIRQLSQATTFGLFDYVRMTFIGEII